jgi:hypothetical protein
MIQEKDVPEFSVACPTLLRDAVNLFPAFVDGCLQFLRDKQSKVLLRRRFWGLFRCMLCTLFCRVLRHFRADVFGGFDLLRDLGNVFLLRHDERKLDKPLSPDRLGVLYHKVILGTLSGDRSSQAF